MHEQKLSSMYKDKLTHLLSYTYGTFFKKLNQGGGGLHFLNDVLCTYTNVNYYKLFKAGIYHIYKKYYSKNSQCNGYNVEISIKLKS